VTTATTTDLAPSDERFMREALAEAHRAEAAGEVPIGAVLVVSGEIVARGYNRPIGSLDPTAHAEIVALRAAAERTGNYRLVDADLYVTVEPCLMCVGAAVHARIRRLVFGAAEPKSGALGSTVNGVDLPGLNHRFAFTGGVLARECGALVQQFFRGRRGPASSSVD
jgi:tRNA(adenine34) deaminase